jgi:PIN domain nuclease of toxin-antitoxin system
LWEITIKISIGKLKLNGNLSDLKSFLETKGFKIIAFDFEDLETLLSLPQYHSDPFDRLIISQSKSKNLVLISNDVQIQKYFS